MPRGRYAPSPTGPLHLGNIRTALLAWLQIRLAGGVFVLRIDDIDAARNRPGGIEQLIDDLRWLGLDWDEGPDVGGPHAPYLQSQRSAIYDAAFEQLRDHGRVFPCHCSRKDIALAASAPHERDAHTIYPGTCRARRSQAGERPSAWRYRVEQRCVRFDDEIAGEIVQRMDRDVGDFVIRRADGGYAYQLATAVDDAMMGITDVVRGADLLASTPRQIELLRALGHAPPRYWHVPLLLDAEGQRMAKRHGSAGLAAARADGFRAADVVGRLAHGLGLIAHLEALSARELLDTLNLSTLQQRLIAAAHRQAGKAPALRSDMA